MKNIKFLFVIFTLIVINVSTVSAQWLNMYYKNGYQASDNLPENPSYFLSIKIFIKENMKTGGNTPQMRNDLQGFLSDITFDNREVFGYRRPLHWKHTDDSVLYKNIPKDLLADLDICEMVQVEVRNDLSKDPSYRECRPGLLSTKGKIYNIYGEEIRFPYNEGVTPEQVYIIVTTSRGNSVMSANPQSIGLMNTTYYDFTLGPQQFYLAGGCEVFPGVWGMHGADASYWQIVSGGDNFNDFSDVAKAKRFFGLPPGYYAADFNYDGIVNNLDVEVVLGVLWDSSRVPRVGIPYRPNDPIGDNPLELPTYTLTATNFSSESGQVSFDILLLNTGDNEFQFKGGQLCLKLDDNIDVLDVTYDSVTCCDTSIFRFNDHTIRLALFTDTGNSYTIQSTPPGNRLAKITIHVPEGSENIPLPIEWINGPGPGIVTKIAALVNGIVEEVTTPKTHYVNLTITGVPTITLMIPDRYSLSQNYPNPFNPTTTITYSILKQEVVGLKIFDITGREIWSQSYGSQAPGTYEINFNASNLTSGTYFYRLTAGDFVEVKKMMLVK